MGLRAVRHAVQSRERARESSSVDAARVATFAIAIATFAFHLANAGKYGYQRDELYFLECARHLALGYVDQPPLIALIAKIAVTLFGESLYAIRLLPAIAAVGTVVLTGTLARRLGGGLLARALAMIGIALAPFYLAVGNLLTMNAFEPLIWLAATYLFFRAEAEDRAWLWTALGVVSGVGLINKYSMFFFLACAIVAIACTPERRAFARRGFWLAIALALAIVAPTLGWQAAHGWPQLAVLHAAAKHVNVVVGPFDFYLQQVLMMEPLSAPLWIAGLVGLLFTSVGGRLRWYGVAYVLLSVLYLALGAKVYYLAPIYPVLFAAGGVLIAERLERVRWAPIAYAVLLLVFGVAIAPEAFPLLPLQAFIRYQHVLDFRGIKMERHDEGIVPQHFADELGWNTLIATLDGVYRNLPPVQRADAAILTRDYGQASAVNVLGRARGLPVGISGHNNFYLWGPRGVDGKTIIAIGMPLALLRTEWRSVREVAIYRDAYVLPDFDDLPIYVCTQPIEPLATWWPAVKNYI